MRLATKNPSHYIDLRSYVRNITFFIQLQVNHLKIVALDQNVGNPKMEIDRDQNKLQKKKKINNYSRFQSEGKQIRIVQTIYNYKYISQYSLNQFILGPIKPMEIENETPRIDRTLLSNQPISLNLDRKSLKET